MKISGERNRDFNKIGEKKKAVVAKAGKKYGGVARKSSAYIKEICEKALHRRVA